MQKGSLEVKKGGRAPIPLVVSVVESIFSQKLHMDLREYPATDQMWGKKMGQRKTKTRKNCPTEVI